VEQDTWCQDEIKVALADGTTNATLG
jgi:hypothetical protein